MRHITSVVVFSLLAQAVGLLRILVIAALFGASINLDAYYLALIVPALVTGVIGGSLQAGFVPVYVRLLTHETRERAEALRGSVFWVLIVALTLLSVAALLTAPYWVHWLASSGGADLWQLTTYASRIIVSSILLNAAGDYLGLVLNCHRRFALAAAAPAANTLVSVPALLLIGPSLDGLAWSVILGGIAQLATVAVGMAAGRLTLPFSWRPAKIDFFAVMDLARPMVPGFVFTQLQLAYVQALPARLGEGAISIFGYATRLQSVVEQVFVIGIGTVLLPHLAEMAARGDRDGIGKLTVQMVAYAMVGAVLLAGGIWLVGKDAVHLLLGRGSFDEATAADVSWLWLYLALGAFPFAVSTSLSKLIMALGRPVILSITAAIVLVAVYILGNLLPGHFGIVGIALVVVLAQCLRLIAYAVSLGPYFCGAGDVPATRWPHR